MVHVYSAILPCSVIAYACVDSWGVVRELGLSGLKPARVQSLNENMETLKQKEPGGVKNLKNGHWEQIEKENETGQT